MSWRRHTRHLTKEVFYDGTTIDGSRLEKAMGEIVDASNKVLKGDTAQRFVATQFHSGFSPQRRELAGGVRAQAGTFPWLKAQNDDASVKGSAPSGSPANVQRFKGIDIPGVSHVPVGMPLGAQYAWTRTFYFGDPVILHAVSALMHLDGGADADRPYTGFTHGTSAPPYRYDTTLGGSVPPPFTTPVSTEDVQIIVDVMCPVSPEDAELTDVEVMRYRWVVNNELLSVYTWSPTAAAPPAADGWHDFDPAFDSYVMTDVRPLNGMLYEYRDLNIPIHQGARVRMSIVIPRYDGSVYTQGTWGSRPWSLQAWSTCLTVLEEVVSR